MSTASHWQFPRAGEPAAAGLAGPPGQEIPALPPGTRIITLENGLILIVREDASAPVVSAQAWCKAGSIDEGRWIGAGLSHMLEHMLFKGTEKRGPGQIDREVQDAGGYMNAYTSFDRTVYYINVPSTGARVAIDILCDIMQHAALPPSEIEKEKQVILREMDMNQDDPSRRASRRLFETAYVRSPYRYTVIGYPDVFNELAPGDIRTYYHEKYAPNNLFFVVAGAVKAAEVEAQVRAAFAGVKALPLPPVMLPIEPAQAAPREVIEEASVELGHFHVAWHIPELRHPDVPVLDVIATLLGNGHSSRLFQEIRERQGLVHMVDAWTYNPGNPGLLGISGVVDPGQFVPARDAILRQVARMTEELVPAAELAKAVKQFTAATLSTRKTMQGQAQDLGGNWLAAHDLNFSERYLAAVKRIAPEDLRRVARQYLVPENRTLYALLPNGAAAVPCSADQAAVENAIQKVTLPNGLRLLLKEDHRLPFVEFRLVFQGGVLSEGVANSGLTLLMAKALLKGTPGRTAEQIVTEVESLGGSIDSYGGNNSFGVNLEVMSEDFDHGLELLADVLLHPIFPSASLDREKEVQLASIRAQRDHLLQLASKNLRHTLFGDRGYGLDLVGSEESVRAVARADLLSHFARLVVPPNAVLAIFGDIDSARVRAAISEKFGAWASPAALPALSAAAPPPAGRLRANEFRDKKQGVIMIGFPGVSIHQEDRYALELVQEALSDLGSRLFVRIRENLGLAYYVGAQHFVGLHPGFFGLYAGTLPEKLDLVEKELLAEVATLRAEGLTAEELARAKAKLLGQKKIARQDLGGFATSAALDELYGLGYENTDREDEYYAGVSLDETLAVIRRYLEPARCVISTVRPPESSGPSPS